MVTLQVAPHASLTRFFRIRTIAALAVAAVLPACSGGGGGGGGGGAIPSVAGVAVPAIVATNVPTAVPSNPPVAAAATPVAALPASGTSKSTNVSITISIALPSLATSQSRRRAASIGAGPVSASIAVSSGNAGMTSVLSCRTCQVVVSVPPGPVSVIATSYDGANASGNALGIATATATAAQGAVVSLASWNPIVASISFAPAAPFVDGVPSATALNETAYDADGDLLSGTTTFASPVALSLQDPAGAYALSTATLTNAAQPTALSYDGAPGARSQIVPSVANATLAASAIAVTAPTYTVRTHTRSLDEAYGTPAQYNASFGFNNWAYVKPYIDLELTPPGTVTQLVRAGGIPTSGYVDINFCSGSYAVGPNQYAHPDCAKLSGDAFYHQDGYTDRPISTSYDGVTTDQIGNPQSLTLQTAALAEFNAELASSGNDDVVEMDDANELDEEYNLKCYGHGTLVSGGYSCAGSPGDTATSPFTVAYSHASWVAGMTTIATALPRPVILNGLQSADPTTGHASSIDVLLATPNSWGAYCESCFYGTNPYVVTSTFLNTQLQNAMILTSAGKNVGAIDDLVTDPVQRQRALADIMLFYDPDRTWIGGGPCGGTTMIHACPEQALTFYEPVLPYPASPQSLARPGGTYAREFNACYDGGVALGPCAAVVNPDTTASHPLPALSRTYAHTLSIQGNSLCNCFGNTGSVSPNGPAPPSTLGGATGYILFS